MEEHFIFSKQYRNTLIAVITGALVVTVAVILISDPGCSRIWSNLLMNNLYFLGISLGAAFFVAVHRISLSGWHTILQKLPDSLTSFIPVAFVLMLLIYFGMNDIYIWSDYEENDPVFANRKIWLNVPFFFGRMVLYFLGWIFLIRFMKRNSEALMTESDIKYHNKRKLFAGLFLVFFGITVSTSSWDWIMSLDRHWYSTIFGWYVLISLFVNSLAFLILFVWFLKRKGYLADLKDDHVHDLSILLFSFSIFWAYQWYAEYFLIWYGHLPEETSYYITRIKDFKTIFYLNLAINFLVPFFGLIRLHSKRNLNWAAFIAAVVMIGHWIDYWLMIMPGAVGTTAGIGLLEVSVTVLYACAFLYVVLRSLARGPLVVKNDPFLKESIEYES